ncbi:MAG: glycosyltransferase family A protein [Methylocystis sp.]
MENSARRPLVTFALLAYNQERYVREAIEGAFAQTYEPLEIILSDDCSPDRTFEIMQEMAASFRGHHVVRCRRRERNLGLAGHINVVISEASGELIAWAAGDDISLPERVSLLAAPMSEDIDVVGSYSAFVNIDIFGNQIGQSKTPPNNGEMTMEKVVSEKQLGIYSQTHVFRKTVFEKFGPLNLSLTNETLPMTFRELCLGKIVYVDEPTVFYRVGSGVSTYGGSDVDACTIYEPLKIAMWRFSAFSQICKDMEMVECVPALCKDQILRKKKYYECLWRINSQRFNFSSVLDLFRCGLIDVRAIAAFMRRNSPKMLRKFYIHNILLR